MSYYITTVVRTNRGECEHEHKNWAYSMFRHVLAEAIKLAKADGIEVLSIHSSNEFGKEWEEDLSDCDFKEFREDFESSHHLSFGSWDEWWDEYIQGIKDSLYE